MRRPRRRHRAARGPRSPVPARPRRTPAPPCSATAPAENRKIALPIRILRRKTDGPGLPLRRLLDITLAQSKRASLWVSGMLNVLSTKAPGEASMSAKNGSIKLVAGNSNPALAQEIADALPLSLTRSSVRRFADMEIFVEIQENVRGSDVFIIQSTSFPTNDH